MEIAELTAVGLGATTLVMVLGALAAGGLRRERRDAQERAWRGTVGVVSTAIPMAGVGRIAHRRRGASSSIPARMIDDSHGAPRGTAVVVVEVEDGVAVVASLD